MLGIRFAAIRVITQDADPAGASRLDASSPQESNDAVDVTAGARLHADANE